MVLSAGLTVSMEVPPGARLRVAAEERTRRDGGPGGAMTRTCPAAPAGPASGPPRARAGRAPEGPPLSTGKIGDRGDSWRGCKRNRPRLHEGDGAERSQR